MSPRQRLLLAGCAAPAGAFFLAFWLLPALRLRGHYVAIATLGIGMMVVAGRYIESMLNTVLLSVAVTLATLAIGATVGIYLARRSFFGKRLLLALLTLPLSFPGVIIGFFVILLGGRQGLVADLSSQLFGERITFAYGLLGLFLAYLYFSLPRAIATSSSHRSVQAHLGLSGIIPRFQAIVARGDYARGKPEPEPFLTAAERLGVAPEDCLALEDSHNGVRAASSAGMMTVMVPDLLAATDEMHRLCVLIARDLHEVWAMLR